MALPNKIYYAEPHTFFILFNNTLYNFFAAETCVPVSGIEQFPKYSIVLHIASHTTTQPRLMWGLRMFFPNFMYLPTYQQQHSPLILQVLTRECHFYIFDLSVKLGSLLFFVTFFIAAGKRHNLIFGVMDMDPTLFWLPDAYRFSFRNARALSFLNTWFGREKNKTLYME